MWMTKLTPVPSERGISIVELCEQTIISFHEDCHALAVLPPDKEPRATDHITQMIEMITTLIEKGFAYEAEGHVLFSVEKMPEYGQLSGRSLDEMIAGARVEVAPYKAHPADFLCSGNQQIPIHPDGTVPGGVAGLVGTLNVRRCQQIIWAQNLTYMPAA